MVKEIDEYFFKKVKRRKEAQCKHCNDKIKINQEAVIIYCADFYTGSPNMIAIVCYKCTGDFIINDMNKNNNL